MLAYCPVDKGDQIAHAAQGNGNPPKATATATATLQRGIGMGLSLRQGRTYATHDPVFDIVAVHPVDLQHLPVSEAETSSIAYRYLSTAFIFAFIGGMPDDQQLHFVFLRITNVFLPRLEPVLHWAVVLPSPDAG